MNTHDKIELPPLPEPGEAMSKWAYDESDMQVYATAAIEADRQRRGEPVALTKALHFAEHVRKCLRNDGEYAPLITKDVDEVISALRAVPQPTDPTDKDSLTVAEPVKVPSDLDILEIWQDFRDYQPDWICKFARSLLDRYGNVSKSEPEIDTSAEHVDGDDTTQIELPPLTNHPELAIPGEYKANRYSEIPALYEWAKAYALRAVAQAIAHDRQKREAIPTDFHPLTERKTRDIAARGYKITGYTLTNERGEKCISDHHAVRWLDAKEFHGLMHPPQPAEPVKHPSYDEDCCQGHKPDPECKCAVHDAEPVKGEPVGEVFTMEPLDGTGTVKSHALLNRQLPAGTKLYAAPVAAQPTPLLTPDELHADLEAEKSRRALINPPHHS